MQNIIKTVFDNTVKSYERFLTDYYPAHGSNGFTERNLTFNISHNYLLKSPNAIIWQEVPLGNREHIDTLIIDNENKSVFLVEAKRLGTEAKHNSIREDLNRITERYADAQGIEERIKNGYSLYALLLVDIWIPRENGDKKENLKQQFSEIKGEGDFSEIIVKDDLSKKEKYEIGFKLVEVYPKKS